MATRQHYKWEMLALLCMAFFFHQGDRAIFGVVLSGIRGDLGLSDEQLGLVGTVLFATLAVLLPFTGIVSDRFSKKWIITISLIFWSSMTLFTGMAGGLVALILLRSIATGGGEAFYAPAAYSLIARFHHRTRALAMSLHQAALYIGVMTSGLLGGWIADQFGWRSAFYWFGGAGILLGIVFIWRLSDQSPAGEEPVAAPKGRDLWKGLLVLFRVPTALFLTCGFTGVVFVNNAFLVWAPEFLGDKATLTMAQAGGMAMIAHHATALCGILMGGPLSDRWALRRRSARLDLQWTALLLGAPAILFMGLSGSLVAVLAGMAVFGFFRGLYDSNLNASLFEVIEPRRRGSTVAVMSMIAFLLGSLSAWLLGNCRHWFGIEKGLSYGFAALGAAYLLGGLAICAARFLTFHRDQIDTP